MTGLFRDREAAERAYGCLTNRGYAGSDVSLLMTDETRQRCFPRTEEPTELGSKAAKGAGVGAVAGGGLGALLVGLAAAGFAVPGLPIVAMGPLVDSFAGGATGGTLGAIVGALVRAGVPEACAEVCD